jgi:SAM-dependent methyltransferase
MLRFAITSKCDGPLNADDADAVAAFRDVLHRYDFAGAGVLSALGGALPHGKFHLREDLPLYLRRLASPTPINTLLKLFVLDQPVDESVVRAAIHPLQPADLQRMGLVERAGGALKARVRLSGYSGLVLAHDRYDERTATLSADHVLDVNPTTVTLAALTVRRRARAALDVGTGCGVLALLAARHSDRVVAVDTNIRALNFASFNAALNGLHNVECREGSLFEPVEGERFDLIVCNPPYVISPDNRYIFRDGGRRGDALSEEIVRRLPGYLEEGGFASVLCNWVLCADDEPAAPPTRWVEGSGCDSWVLWTKTQDPLTYAALWNRSRDGEAYGDALERWTAYFADLGADAIGMGGVILRRRTGASNWVRTNRLPEGTIEDGDRHIQRAFAAEDRLSRLDDRALLSVRFTAAGDHRLQQRMAFRDGEYEIDSAEVRFDEGLRFSGDVDPYTIHLLARCNGRRTLADIASEVAEKGGRAPGEVAAACALIARRLASLGFLIPDE